MRASFVISAASECQNMTGKGTNVETVVDSSLSDSSAKVPLLASGLLALLAATATNLPKGPGLACALMLLVALVHARHWKCCSAAKTLPLAGLLLLAGLSGLSHLLIDGWHALDTPLRYLLALPVVFWLSRIRLQPGVLFAGFVVGALVAGLTALYQLLVVPESLVSAHRADGLVGKVFTFGTLVSVQAAACVCAAVYFYRRGNNMACAASVAGVALGITGCVLSGNRGSWVALAPALLLLFLLFGKSLGARQVLGLMLSGVLVLGLAWTSVPFVKQRTEAALRELTVYSVADGVQHEDCVSYYGSVGIRLELWRAALREFQKSPLIGLSFKERSRFDQQLKNEGYCFDFHEKTDGTGSAHSEFFDALAKRGLLGVIAIFLLYLIPARHFVRCWRQCVSHADKAVPAVGLAMVTVYAFAGLTERFLFAHAEAMFYAFMVTGLWFMSSQVCDKPAGQKSGELSREQAL